jgi:hypothetical protein
VNQTSLASCEPHRVIFDKLTNISHLILQSQAWLYLATLLHAMQLLPEHTANTLAQLLLQFNRLHAPNQLDAFRDCLTALHINPGSGIHLDAEWLAHIGSLR